MSLLAYGENFLHKSKGSPFQSSFLYLCQSLFVFDYMAKKVKEETLNLDNILFKCRDILRNAKNSGSFFEKRDMMLTLVFLRFIGEKYEDYKRF